MGDRSAIVITGYDDEAITIYGHWSGETNIEAVKDVMKVTDRVGDFSYLVAQIFYKFAVTYGMYDGDSGFGIFAGEIDADIDSPTVYVDATTGSIFYRDNDWEEQTIESLRA